MLDGLRRLLDRVRPDDDFPTPPRTVEDAHGRPIHYRAFTDADVDALAAMYDDFDPAMRAQGTPPVGEAAVRDWLDHVTTGPGVVARHDDRVVGHVAFVPDDDTHELAIFVHQDYQRARVGTELIRTGLGHARSQAVTRVWLSVESWKRGAQKLYRRHGFTTDDPVGATYRMSRRL
ncbi:GNAT family N-acetyltransferase [Halocalculus aciditolerans]|uniref:GNAT family N-acetyltransferase n=1 Tax=Halocalculus aciditolerans TaxID=1383812 RepID=A0A830FHA5_9EURY|nr:GNAT family N-acetyltransferase [Halocalculus aciditolerans]GGL52599.1 GNAT family N-acetyltransferase [Halocalculus aciditolerans]